MNKEEQIEKIKQTMVRSCNINRLYFEQMAEDLYNAGYGDTKQAVKEFAEKLKEKFIRLEKRYGDEADRDENAIPNLQFEFYKPALERDGAFANGQATMANKALYIIDELVKEVCGD